MTIGSVEGQILVGLAVIVLAAIIIGIAKALINAVKGAYTGLTAGQARITEQCQEIRITLTAFEGNFQKGDQWMQMHHDADLRQFLTVEQQLKGIQDQVADAPCQK